MHNNVRSVRICIFYVNILNYCYLKYFKLSFTDANMSLTDNEEPEKANTWIRERYSRIV